MGVQSQCIFLRHSNLETGEDEIESDDESIKDRDYPNSDRKLNNLK